MGGKAKISGGRRVVPMILLMLSVLVLSVGAPSVYGQEEGGYVYNRGESRFVDNVYNFLRNFSYEQYYWCNWYMFREPHNDSYADAMDFAYYSGHGNNWYIGMGPGAVSPRGVNLRTGCPLGDWDCEFIVFQSCAVIPSCRDTSQWASAWTGPDGMFQGLHQAIGYRTNSYSGNGISRNFGRRVAARQCVWQAWFAAVNDERSWWRGSFYPGMACVVLYPGHDYDVYPCTKADPPAGSGWLRCYYQY